MQVCDVNKRSTQLAAVRRPVGPERRNTQQTNAQEIATQVVLTVYLRRMDTNAVLSAYTAPHLPALFPRSARQIRSHGRRRRRRRRQRRPLACADRLANLWKQLTAMHFNDGGPAFCRTHCGQRANQNRRHLANFRRNGKTDCGATVTNLLAAELLKHLKEKARLLRHHSVAQISAEQWTSRISACPVQRAT